MKWRVRGTVWFLLTLLFLATGCAEQPDAAQPRFGQPAGEIAGAHTVGQTFIATVDNLHRIDVLMATYARTNRGPVVFYLRDDPAGARDLARIEIEAATIRDNKYHTFRFAPIPDAAGRSFYFALEAPEATPGNAVTVWQMARDVYPDGHVVVGGQPGEGDLAFRLYADYGLGAIVGDAGREIWRRGGALLLAALVFWLPGLGLLAVLLPGEVAAWRERLLAAPALTLALLPVLFLLTWAAGLRPGAWLAWGPAILGAIALVWRGRRLLRRAAVREWRRSDARWPDLALVAVVGLVIGARLLAIRGLTVPSWGDSVQHAVMAQLMVDNGGLFESWLPYAPYQGLTVHFGFAAVVAAWQWVAGLPAAEATLVAGQAVNAVAILALYPLAVRLAKGNLWAGVGALLVAGLLSPMPAFYVNWGRYAQLTGQAILPLALWLLWPVAAADQSPRRVWKALLLAGGAVAGMTLSYYRMPFYYAAFVLAWLLFHVLPDYRRDARRWATLVMHLALVGVVGVAFVLPWLSNIAGGKLATGLSESVAVAAPVEQVLAEYQIWRDVATYAPWVLIGLSVVATAWAAIRRQWTAVSPAAWLLILVALPAGRLVGLPGANFMQCFAVAIALYMPVGLLAGWLVEQVVAWLSRVGRWGLALALAALLLVAGWGGRSQITVVEPFFRMVFPADQVALDWIRENTSADARFLVNGFTIYNGHSSVGSDAGWWIPLLARRENTMPPQYALLNEEPMVPGQKEAVTQLVRDLQSVSLVSPEGRRLLCRAGVTHAYVGQAQGMVGYDAAPLLRVEDLLASPFFDLIYQQDQARVFALDGQACDDLSVGPETTPGGGEQD
jgi:hypothetical protein